MNRMKSAFLWAVIGFGIVSLALSLMVSRSTSSTAAIGYLFIPFRAAPWSIPFFIFGFCLTDLRKFLQRKAAGIPAKPNIGVVTAAILALSGIGYSAYGIVFTIAVRQVRSMNERELIEFLDHSLLKNDKFALGALAENPQATPELLDRVARLSSPELHNRMLSVWPVMGANVNGLAVMRLVAMHKNVSEETLRHLSESPDEYVRSSVAENPNTPISILRDIANSGDQLTSWSLAANPKTPPDILAKLADVGDKYARSSVARNPCTTIETLAKLATDPEWDVRRDVAMNPKTSPETLESLAKDNNQTVREQAQNRSQDTPP